ncbi:zinc-dependent metalloprotease [Flavobacterium lipolyticum]|uniref:M12 family metallo-peptidase n=1 Tax=Flavobacterium lipolyticum TaxID=2893754 RepID=A0ABS8M4G5_9FLAO|nr:zinc-dependent metalloprotease [Flavobacterium sp. F-126]MCC9019564.1 M12 family metallo-peptidase [Flavobacterium sp. F-126]
MKKTLLLFLLISIFSNAQELKTDLPGAENLPGLIFKLKTENFKRNINSKRQSSKKINDRSIVLTLIDGTSEEFILSENNLTQERIDNVISFDGFSKDKQSKIKLTLIGDKITAIIKSDKGYFIVEPYKTESGEYRIYESSEMFGEKFECDAHVDEVRQFLNERTKRSTVTEKSVTNFPYGDKMRTFRMAVAATGEFTTALGSQDAALAEILTVMNLVNLIFESELSLSFQLIPATIDKTLIFKDATTDPFTINPTGVSGTNSQTGFNTLNSSGILPYTSYDIGHTFNIVSGSTVQGHAGPQPCSSTSKARAWTEWSITVSKSTIANLIIHEIGHQFNAGHTYNATGGLANSPTFCTIGWNSSSAVEPGAGTTIMSYGTNCVIPIDQTNTGNNKLNYFHSKSIDQIINSLNTGATCFTSLDVANTPPLANAGNIAITIPKGTPFKLKGIGTDVENSNLSYTWEQIDIAVDNDKGAMGSTINGSGGYSAVNGTTTPLFRSQQSNTTTERYFPKMKFVLENQNEPPTLEAEALPQVARNMNMRFTVRDNSVVAGGVDSDKILITVTNDGPLTVTYPNSNVTINADSNINVTWDVNQTDLIKSTVDIILSTDGGNSFPYVLASNVSNNGSATVTIPLIPNKDKARIKVVAVINDYAEFFDVSNTDFIINSSCNSYDSIIVEENRTVTANQASIETNLNLQPQTPSNSTYVSKTIAFTTSTMSPQGFYVYNADRTAPSLKSLDYNLVPLRVKVTEDGNYTLSYPSGFLIISIYKGNQATESNFISSNGRIGTGTNISYTNSFTVKLKKGVEYFIAATNYRRTPNNDVFTVSINGPGRFFDIINPTVGVNYSYIAINTLTDKIISTNTTADFSTLATGTYTIHGISFVGSAADLINKSINEIIQQKICYQLSDNSITLIITSPLGINANTKNTIKITPNPVTDVLRVHTQENITHYEIYDSLGRLVEKNDVFKAEINFSKFQSGMYLLLLHDTDNSVYRAKIIKK